MRASRRPPTTRGRDRHVVAIVLEPDTLALEVAIALRIFGRRIPSVADRSGDDPDSPYEVLLLGEQPRLRLGLGDGFAEGTGIDFGPLSPLSAASESDTVIVPGVEVPTRLRSDSLLHALRVAGQRGARLASFGSGAFALAQAGLL
ncbi:MAG TPA: hypothetical protein VIL55_14765, partial [Naasia sp.]